MFINLLSVSKENAVKKVDQLFSKLESKITSYEKRINKRYDYIIRQRCRFGDNWVNTRTGVKYIKKTDDLLAKMKSDIDLHQEIINNYDKYIDSYYKQD